MNEPKTLYFYRRWCPSNDEDENKEMKHNWTVNVDDCARKSQPLCEDVGCWTTSRLELATSSCYLTVGSSLIHFVSFFAFFFLKGQSLLCIILLSLYSPLCIKKADVVTVLINDGFLSHLCPGESATTRTWIIHQLKSKHHWKVKTLAYTPLLLILFSVKLSASEKPFLERSRCPSQFLYPPLLSSSLPLLPLSLFYGKHECGISGKSRADDSVSGDQLVHSLRPLHVAAGPPATCDGRCCILVVSPS